MASDNQLLLCVLCIFISPLAVALHMGVNNAQFWINLVLYLLTYILGVIHGLYLILTS